jgi:3D (Asp-Asp-Asp) domain-containing protein
MSKFLKSIFFMIIALLWLSNFLQNTVSTTNETYFIITAYYSPLPNQKYYITWSYRWDIRLNGKWHTTASWKPVKVWILAAPTKYPFWTKIYFNRYGIATVEDRWWAIVKAWIRWHEHDRIDIWMWYGDEWLMRAKRWGKRSIKWKVVSRNSEVSLKFSKNVLNNIENIKVNPDNHKNRDVKRLQENFKKLWLYNWKIDWKYGSIKNALIKFQVKNRVIRSINSLDAWWFWPKTYITLLKRYWSKDILVRQKNIKIIETNPKVQIILNHEEIKLNWDEPQIEEIKKLQRLFKKLWMYDWSIDWKFNSIKRKLLDFQKQAWIIKQDNSWWAWYFWEKTKAALVNHFESKDTIVKKKITIDDISYSTLDEIWKKLKKSRNKKVLIKKLLRVKTKLNNKSRIDKIDYLINILK